MQQQLRYWFSNIKSCINFRSAWNWQIVQTLPSKFQQNGKLHKHGERKHEKNIHEKGLNHTRQKSTENQDTPSTVFQCVTKARNGWEVFGMAWAIVFQVKSWRLSAFSCISGKWYLRMTYQKQMKDHWFRRFRVLAKFDHFCEQWAGQQFFFRELGPFLGRLCWWYWAGNSKSLCPTEGIWLCASVWKEV